MKDITFKITEKEIQRYLENHKDLVLNKEALFVRYIKENAELSIEALNMLTMKYNYVDIQSDFDHLEENEILSSSFINFEEYLKKQKLDLTGVCHIIIPSIGLYSSNRVLFPFQETFTLHAIATKLGIGINENINNILSTTVENYTMTGQITEFNDVITSYSYFKMGREKCRKILLEEENIYGKENVQKIRKLVRERE